LNLDFYFNVKLIILVPLFSAICIVVAGFWGVREVVNKPPMYVLRDV